MQVSALAQHGEEKATDNEITLATTYGFRRIQSKKKKKQNIYKVLAV